MKAFSLPAAAALLLCLAPFVVGVGARPWPPSPCLRLLSVDARGEHQLSGFLAPGASIGQRPC